MSKRNPADRKGGKGRQKNVIFDSSNPAKFKAKKGSGKSRKPYQKWDGKTSRQEGEIPSAYRGATPSPGIATSQLVASKYEQGNFPIPISAARKLGSLITSSSDVWNLSVRGCTFIPIAILSTDIVAGLEVDRKVVDIKDIDDTNERTPFKAWLYRVASAQQALIAQMNIRAHAGAKVGTIDAAGTITEAIWTSTDWVNINQVVSKMLFIPSFLQEVIYALNPRVIDELPNKARRFKGAMHMYWYPHMDAATFRTLVGEIQQYQQAALSYCNKMGIKTSHIGAMPGPLVNNGPSEYLAFFHSLPMPYREAGATKYVNVGEYSEAGSALWYESLSMYYREGGLPNPLMGLVRYTHGLQHANNLRGMYAVVSDALSGVAIANDKPYWYGIAYNGTAFALQTLNQRLIAFSPLLLADSATETSIKIFGAAALNIEVAPQKLLYGLGWWLETLSSSWWSELNIWNWFGEIRSAFDVDKAKDYALA